MNETYIHIGLTKTGSTFLQRNVFPYIKGISYYGKDLPPIIRKNSNKVLISNEDWSGCPHNSSVDNRLFLVEQLKSFFPKACIIVFTRHKGWKRSLYSTYVKDGGRFGFAKWLNRVFNSSYLDQDEYVEQLIKTFKQVCVIRFEDFKQDPVVVVNSLCRFMDVDVPEFKDESVGMSLDGWKLGLCRILNFFPVKPKDFFYRWNIYKYRRKIL